MLTKLRVLLLILGVVSVPALPAADWELSGVVAGEVQDFFHDPMDPRQFEGLNFSAYIQPELFTQWADGSQRFVFVPFYRVDQHDDRRTHGDIRELAWSKIGDDWELRAGFLKVFWGVTEFLHLVDVINQTDLVENIDGEEKLGQPAVNLSLARDWGTVDFFVLPYFRERTFPGTEGRLRFQLPVHTSLADYESSNEQWHVDLAARWFQYFGDLEMSLYHFYGTSREPRFLTVFDRGELVLAPFYDVMHQTALTLQLVQDAWLWKFEGFRRQANGETFYAGTGGFEYTLVGIADTAMDLGLIGEFIVDTRNDQADKAPPTPFQHDVVVGARLAVNDAASSEVLFTYTQDVKERSRFFSLEASRRIGDSLKLSLETRFFVDVAPSNALYGARDDDYIQLELGWYF